MEKDFESWFHYQQHSNRQSACLNSLSDPLGIGKQWSTPAYMNPYTNEVPTNGTFPAFVFSGLPQSNRANQVTEPRNWFYCLPRFRQGFVPPVNSVVKEKIPFGNTDNCGVIRSHNTGTTVCTQKKFLVFDQSGDQTTLIYSSGLGTQVPYLTSINPKPPAPYDLFKEDLGIKREKASQLSPFLGYEHNEENQRDEDSEMREDTEELNALLYSDEYSEYSDDDEVTSTGHSPSTMTEHGVHQLVEEGEEEVASSFGPTKRRKLLDEGYDIPSSSPIKAGSSKEEVFKKVSELEDDAESSCGNFLDAYHVPEESTNSLSGKKRSRKERIRETVSILQSIIPGGKGKDATVVIDEAIHYLKCLKVKAKSLGLEDAAAL